MKCPTCNGSKRVFVVDCRFSDGYGDDAESHYIECPQCDGSGKIPDEYEIVSWNPRAPEHKFFSFRAESDEEAEAIFNEEFLYNAKYGWNRFKLMKVNEDGTKVCIANDCI